MTPEIPVEQLQECVVRLRARATIDGLLESIDFIWPDSHSGLHVWDVNWFDGGDYQPGILEPALLADMERFFKAAEFIGSDQQLKGSCYYSSNRANMIINVSGGEFDADEPVIICYLDQSAEPFDFDFNPAVIEAAKRNLSSSGRVDTN